MKNAFEYVGKDQNWQDQQTIYWFETNRGKFGVVEGGDINRFVDDEGCSIRGRGDSYIIVGILHDAVTDEMRAD